VWLVGWLVSGAGIEPAPGGGLVIKPLLERFEWCAPASDVPAFPIVGVAKVAIVAFCKCAVVAGYCGLRLETSVFVDACFHCIGFSVGGWVLGGTGLGGEFNNFPNPAIFVIVQTFGYTLRACSRVPFQSACTMRPTEFAITANQFFTSSFVFDFVFGFDWQNIDEFDVAVVIPCGFKKRGMRGDVVRVKLIGIKCCAVKIESGDFVFRDVVECGVHFFVLVFGFARGSPLA
jgi:hypothetical protein